MMKTLPKKNTQGYLSMLQSIYEEAQAQTFRQKFDQLQEVTYEQEGK